MQFIASLETIKYTPDALLRTGTFKGHRAGLPNEPDVAFGVSCSCFTLGSPPQPLQFAPLRPRWPVVPATSIAVGWSNPVVDHLSRGREIRGAAPRVSWRPVPDRSSAARTSDRYGALNWAWWITLAQRSQHPRKQFNTKIKLIELSPHNTKYTYFKIIRTI